MNCFRLIALGLLVILSLPGSVPLRADDDFRPLFNGKDLTGWVPVNVAPETFTVRDGMIVSTGKPTGVLRTDRPVRELRHRAGVAHLQPGGNAGLFVWSDALPAVGVPFTRSFEVQILDGQDGPNYTSHGDVFGIWGATMTPDRPHPAGWMRCLPSEKRAKPSPEWNHYRVICQDGAIKLAVNGKEVSGAGFCMPRKGYICLEAEGSECHFRNLRIQERPASGAGPAETAAHDEGFISLYSGLDLRGWRSDPGHTGHWRAKDSILDYDGKSTPGTRTSGPRRQYGDVMLIADWRLPGKPAPRRDRSSCPMATMPRTSTARPRPWRSPMPAIAASCSAARRRPRSISPVTRSARVRCMVTGSTRRCPQRSAPAPSPRSRPTARWESGTGS